MQNHFLKKREVSVPLKNKTADWDTLGGKKALNEATHFSLCPWGNLIFISVFLWQILGGER